jgi:hypothetical protein
LSEPFEPTTGFHHGFTSSAASGETSTKRSRKRSTFDKSRDPDGYTCPTAQAHFSQPVSRALFHVIQAKPS